MDHRQRSHQQQQQQNANDQPIASRTRKRTAAQRDKNDCGGGAAAAAAVADPRPAKSLALGANAKPAPRNTPVFPGLCKDIILTILSFLTIEYVLEFRATHGKELARLVAGTHQEFLLRKTIFRCHNIKRLPRDNLGKPPLPTQPLPSAAYIRINAQARDLMRLPSADATSLACLLCCAVRDALAIAEQEDSIAYIRNFAETVVELMKRCKCSVAAAKDAAAELR